MGLLLAIPGFVGSALDPLVGVLSDTGRRRALLFWGGLMFALSAALTAGSTGFWILLAALVIGNPATGAFVSIAQATLMDAEPRTRERNMARWTLAGSLGYVGGPLLLAAALAAGLGWRSVFVALAVVAVPLAVATRRAPVPRGRSGGLLAEIAAALRALRQPEVVRWLTLLEGSDLMLDVFHGFLALYFVDVAGLGPVSAGLAVAVWTGAGLAGDAFLLLALRVLDGRAYLRLTAAAVLGAYPAFLLVQSLSVKLVLLAALGVLNSGWYAIPKARLYEALPGRSGTAVAVGGVAGMFGAAVPLGLGLVANRVGLGPTMWLLLAAPLALLVGVPRR